jgi:hypothetical protein
MWHVCGLCCQLPGAYGPSQVPSARTGPLPTSQRFCSGVGIFIITGAGIIPVPLPDLSSLGRLTPLLLSFSSGRNRSAWPAVIQWFSCPVRLVARSDQKLLKLFISISQTRDATAWRRHRYNREPRDWVTESSRQKLPPCTRHSATPVL